MTLAPAAAIVVAVALGAGVRPVDPAATAFDARMAASAGAAERLQGELDGCWRLVDARGRPLFVFQISDPPQHAGPLQGAWRRADGGAAGFVDTIIRAGRRLTLNFEVDGGAAQISVTQAGTGRWRGWLNEANGRRVGVRLSR